MDLAREKKIMLEDDKELTADDVMKRKNDEPTTKRAEVTAGRAKAVIEKEDEDAKDAPPELEKRVNAMIDVLKEVNLGIDEELSPTYLSDLLAIDEEIIYIELLKEFKDVFDWSYKEMPDLDPKVVVHHLAVKNNACPVKHAQMFFRPDLVPLIESEVNKLIESGFIREVMPFGLKNAGAIYQRSMQNIFDNLLHTNVKCYVDDLVVKSREKSYHLKDLRVVFKLLRRYQLRMNPLK
ncbi:uncharacterized protein LOC107806741 [Nicotiana tabacum]|uniref:Uncharacterized protein LOC107806741 n=1 Tax=Nicotiana tabacum TaxID=4097 RepID=A0AC58RWT6_TOBAC